MEVLSWEDRAHGNQFYGSFDLCLRMCVCVDVCEREREGINPKI